MFTAHIIIQVTMVVCILLGILLFTVLITCRFGIMIRDILNLITHIKKGISKNEEILTGVDMPEITTGEITGMGFTTPEEKLLEMMTPKILAAELLTEEAEQVSIEKINRLLPAGPAQFLNVDLPDYLMVL